MPQKTIVIHKRHSFKEQPNYQAFIYRIVSCQFLKTKHQQLINQTEESRIQSPDMRLDTYFHLPPRSVLI